MLISILRTLSGGVVIPRGSLQQAENLSNTPKHSNESVIILFERKKEIYLELGIAL